MLDPRDQIRIGQKRKPAQRLIQVTRTYLAGSPGTMDRLRQADLLVILHIDTLALRPRPFTNPGNPGPPPVEGRRNATPSLPSSIRIH